MTHRGHCPRCGAQFTSPVKFSHHFDYCTIDIQPTLLLEIFKVTVLGDDECWPMDEEFIGRKPPKIGIGRKETVRAHVAMAIATHGDFRNTNMVCHRCDNVRCLNPSHMYWGTHQTNSKDAWRNGRRTMSQDQLDAMVAGLRSSEKNKQAIATRNRETAATRRGKDHWTHRDQETMDTWKEAVQEGRARAKREKVMPDEL